MTVHQCPEQQSSDSVRLNSTEKRGCVCERRREESPPNVHHRLVRAASSYGEDYYTEHYGVDYYDFSEPEIFSNLTEPETFSEREGSASSAASVLSVKIFIITVSVLASLCPLHF